jgi:hypothetical protein
MQKKLIVGLGLVAFAVLGAEACSSSSGSPSAAEDAGGDVETVTDSGTSAPETSTTPEAGEAGPAASDAASEASVDGGDAAPGEAGPGDAGSSDAAVGDAE